MEKENRATGRRLSMTLTFICARCTRETTRKRPAKDPEKVYCGTRCRRRAVRDRRPRKTTRSKIELFLEERFGQEYPNLEVLYNSRSAVGLELDIYFPGLKLAVELNGIFHYQPIFGKRSLFRTQRNDMRKRARCEKKNIHLMVLDISEIKKFTPEINEELFEIIRGLVDERL